MRTSFFFLCALIWCAPANAQFTWPFGDDGPRNYRYYKPYEPYPRYYDRRNRSPYEAPKRDLRPEAKREQMPDRIGILGKVIVVFVNHQQYAAYDDGVPLVLEGVAMRGPVSTGMPGHRTPLSKVEKGSSPIEYKKADYVSLTYPEPYGGAPMPYAMFWNRKGGYALHAGEIPRWRGDAYGASKGCVRLTRQHAELLFKHFSGPDVRVIITEDALALQTKWEVALAQAK